MSDAWNFATVRDLGRMIRSGETTPTALTEHVLARLETVGRRLNAVVTITRERALREARQAEAELAAGYDRGPLHGIPYGAKDLLAAAGYPTTWGAEPLRDQTFPTDATVVARLRDAGAVLAAKLAMVELAGGLGYIHADAALTGPGLNPWNPSAWSGGSSSGSGSAVGGGVVPFAIGSETWGSILSPSSYCGVTGLRPTSGRVSRHGAMALSWTLDKIGPMGRSADDCGLVLAAIAGRDPHDPTTLRAPFRYDPDRARTSGFRLGVIRAELDDMQPEVRANFEAALTVLAEVGTVEDVELPDLPYSKAAQLLVSVEGASAFEDLIERGVVAELRAPEDRTGGYAGLVVPAVDYLRALRVRKKARLAMDDLLSRYDGLVTPATAYVANPVDLRRDLYGRTRELRLQASAASNLVGAPAVGVPNGFGERGLPTAFQVIGRAGSEDTILAVARAYQSRTTWHTRHPEL